MIWTHCVSIRDAPLSATRLKREKQKKKASPRWLQRQLRHRKISWKMLAVLISKLQFHFNLTVESFNTLSWIYHHGCVGTSSSANPPLIPVNCHAIRQDIFAAIMLPDDALSHKIFATVWSHAYNRLNGRIESTMDPTCCPARPDMFEICLAREDNSGSDDELRDFFLQKLLMFYHKWIPKARMTVSFLSQMNIAIRPCGVPNILLPFLALIWCY